VYTIKGKYSSAHVMTDEDTIDEMEYKQILNFVNCHVFTNDSIIMPDYHYGKGAVIGFTMKLTDKIIPNIVGVDIGCNMLLVYLNKLFDIDESAWLSLGRKIRKTIPMAREYNKEAKLDFDRQFPWIIFSSSMRQDMVNFNKHLGIERQYADYNSKWFYELCERVNCKPVTAVNSIGSLGGGNHFIEFGESSKKNKTVVTVHAGSRNLGLKVANYWQKVAKEQLVKRYRVDFENTIKEIKDNNPPEKWNTLIKAAKNPPTPTGLEYLEGDNMLSYLYEMYFCQSYAYENVLVMMSSILEVLNQPVALLKEAIHTVHNYVNFEDLIIRKGAVSSYNGQKMIIPFNMEDGLLVCEGKSNPEWNFSAPHGAGRLFGRKEIKRSGKIDMDVIKERMKSKGSHISIVPMDEVKEAYKDPKFIEDSIAPTAEIVDRVRPILTLKADD